MTSADCRARPRGGLLPLALAVIAVMSGCTTVTGGGRADVVKPGDVEAGANASVDLLLVKRAPGRPVPVPSYVVGAGARGGVRDGVDVGVRGWGAAAVGMSNVGALIDGKLQFVDGDAFDASISVGVSTARFDIGGAETVTLGVPVRLTGGWNLDGDAARKQIFFGTTFEAQTMWSASAKPVHVGWFGGFVGAAWPLAIEGLELRPEFGMRYSPINWNGLVESKDRRGLTQCELSLGLVYTP